MAGLGMSAKGQKRTSQPLFDHVVGEAKDRSRDRQPNFLAVLRLMTRSNFVVVHGYIIRLALLKNLVHEKYAARRYMEGRFSS